MIDPLAFVHDRALVDDSVVIGAGSRVWQFATVIRGTRLGENCNVGAGAVLEGPRFGDRCKIGPNVHMGAGFVIGNDVFIGTNVVFANDLWPAVDRDGFDDVALRSGAVAIKVENRASIGCFALILPGVVIGEGATIAGHATVSRDVPAGMLWTRDGQVVPKPGDWRRRRMRLVSTEE